MVLFVFGGALAPVVMLGLCGIPIGLAGLVLMWVGLVVGGSGGPLGGGSGALLFLVGLALAAWATSVGLWPVADWTLDMQRGGAAPWPMQAMLHMAAWSAAAALMMASGAWLHRMDPWLVGLVAIMSFLLPGLTVGTFLLLLVTLGLPLTA
ncbi:MAG: hypothetical protein WD118_11575 [Phycisphaeraceae bacterium]